MAKSDSREKNTRIMNLVVILVWLVVFLTVILGIVFPLVYVSSLKELCLKEQGVSIKLTTAYVRDYMHQKEQLVSLTADLDELKDKKLPGVVIPALKGIPERGALPLREDVQRILRFFPSFRFFAYLTPDVVRPVFLQPYQFQSDLTQEQYDKGYLFRDWARKTIERYEVWDRKTPVTPYVSDAFLSQPGNIPAVSLSLPVVDDEKKMTGILYANMSLTTLSDFVRGLSYGKTGKIFLVDSDGHLLAHPDIVPGVEAVNPEGKKEWALRDFSGNPMVSLALQGTFSPGFFRLPGTDTLVISSYAVVPDLGWIVVLQQDVSEAFSIVKIYSYIIVFLVILTVLVTVTMFLYISRETEETAREHKELVVISETDALTGLLNRRSMLSRMTQLVSDADETGLDFVLALFDIDDFKKINDTLGHLFGDVVLREIASRTVSVLRAEDLLFRWGGEEFLVIIRNCDLVRGRAIAEKIRKVIGSTPVNDGDKNSYVSVTIGVCQYHRGPIESMISDADIALYEGKRNGKNRVVVYDRDRTGSQKL